MNQEPKFKYQTGDELFYVCPFVFTIELVKIDYCYEEDTGDTYYIEQTGAYLREWDLHRTLIDARKDAHSKLEKFYKNKKAEIDSRKPKLEELP